MIGFLMTLRSFSCDVVERMLRLCSSWTMRPAKRLKVRGMRTVGETSMRTPFAVWM